MSNVKITDLVPQETINKIKELDEEIRGLLDTYTDTAKELAKGVDIKVRVIGDIDKLEKLLVDKSKEAADAGRRLNDVMAEQSRIVANTTNTISRQLMEQEKVNKAQRETYTEHEKVKNLLDRFHDTYENQTRSLAKITRQLAENKKAQSDNEKALAAGLMTMEQFTGKQAALIAQHRSLTQEKRTLTQIMTAEEKAAQSQEGSYVHMSQQLELLKKAYKDLSEEGRNADFGKELEASIQNLDAHLKDVAADMGEFQRNVGNYAIAGQNGVVSTESLMAALNQQAVTTKDVSDQSKILLEARNMLDTSDAQYAETVALINEKLAENSMRLTDVSDIMEVQATSAAEAEAQNKRLMEALKQVDQSGEDARQKIAELNAKIAENDKVIAAGSASKATLKKDLKELVLEIANLSIEYQNLSDEEKASAEGRALADHIRDLTEQAGVLKDAIADTNQAIANAASDTRAFDQLGGTLKLAIDGFGLATGAAEMLGISSEDLAKVQTKLQAALVASNAMQSIQNSLQKQSAVMQGVNLLQTKLRTVAENLHTAAQGKGTIATAALTAAQWAFNAAANANPIGLVVVAIVACIAAVWGLVKAFTAFFGTSDEAIESYKQQKQAIEELCESNDKLIERMKARGATEAELLVESLKNKQVEKDAYDDLFRKASKLYDEDEDEYKEALEAKKKADDDFKASKEDGLNYLLKIQTEVNAYEREQAIGTLAYKKEIIEEEKRMQLQLAAMMYANGELTRKQYEDIVASVKKYAEINIKKAEDAETKKVSPSGRSSSSGADDARKQAEELKKAVRAGEDALLKIITDSLERQRQAEMLSYNRQLEDLRAKLAKTKDTEVKLREALNNQIQGIEAEHQRKLADIQASQIDRANKAEADFIALHLSMVQSGSQEEFEWKMKALSNQYNAELAALVKSENNKTIASEMAEQMRIDLAEKYAGLREDLAEEHSRKLIEKNAAEFAEAQSDRDNDMMAELVRLQSRYAAELELAGSNEAKRAQIKARYEAKSAEIAEKYAIQSAQASVNMFEGLLKNSDLTAKDREKIEKDLAAARIKLEKAVTDHVLAENERKELSDEALKEKRIKNTQQWLQVASNTLNGISDLMSAVSDAKIEQIENEQEAVTKASESEIANISQLVEKKVITEEEGEARKRAAEAQTAKKNEELEKKKQQLKQKQAVWDKANSIAQAAIATALAITQALPNVVLAAIAGAMGALQIATIVATPIPKYAKGTDYHKGGPAIVGDGGRHEVVMFNGDTWLTPDKPTLVDIPAGASVLPDVSMLDMEMPGLISLPENDRTAAPVVVNNDYSRLERGIRELAGLIRAQTRQQKEDAANARYELFKQRI